MKIGNIVRFDTHYGWLASIPPPPRFVFGLIVSDYPVDDDTWGIVRLFINGEVRKYYKIDLDVRSHVI